MRRFERARRQVSASHKKKMFWVSHLGEGYNPCLLLIFLGRISLKRSRKKQAKRERFLKRMKSRRKWKHGRSNIEKSRRLRDARALLADASSARPTS